MKGIFSLTIVYSGKLEGVGLEIESVAELESDKYP